MFFLFLEEIRFLFCSACLLNFISTFLCEAKRERTEGQRLLCCHRRPVRLLAAHPRPVRREARDAAAQRANIHKQVCILAHPATSSGIRALRLQRAEVLFMKGACFPSPPLILVACVGEGVKLKAKRHLTLEERLSAKPPDSEWTSGSC